MDDTLWISKSLTQLKDILDTAASFYQMAKIQVNPTKSILVSNTKSTPTISFMNTTIQANPINTPFKFLGCWFTTNLNYSIQSKLIIQEAYNLIHTLQTKQITDKQASYIINNVLIPTIEYRIHNIILSRSTCNRILSKYLTVFKHKAKLAKTTPNSTILNHNIYGIKNIWDIQLQHHTSNFILRLNNNTLLGLSTHIRLQQLQNNLWSTTNILKHPNPIIDGLNKNSTTFKIIKLLRHLDVSITAHQDNLRPYTIQLPYTTLESLLQNHPSYHTFKKQLRSKYIMFLEQLTSADNTILLTWPHLSPRLNFIPTGKIPKWFLIIKQTTISNYTT
jgi:hypothetical protein